MFKKFFVVAASLFYVGCDSNCNGEGTIYSAKILVNLHNLTDTQSEEIRKTDAATILIAILHLENNTEFSCVETRAMKKFVVKYNLDNN